MTLKKYEITNTMNGGAIVTQKHAKLSDCDGQYGDVWSFANCTDAGRFVDSRIQYQKFKMSPGLAIKIDDPHGE